MSIEDYKVSGESSGRCRAAIYGLLVRVFVSLPDAGLVDDFTSGVYDDLFNGFGGIGNKALRYGISYLDSYRSSIQSAVASKILDEIAVDRTRILRVTSDKAYRLPYESLYKASRSASDVISQVKSFYMKSGMVPAEDAGEMPDYLGVELDFMYALCQMETDLLDSGQDSMEIVELEKEFLNEHLGKWISIFCDEAGKQSCTDFYKGFLKIMSGFIEIEANYLSGISLS
jgi:putative dimethyl sulfoxide reductase chaperone